MLKTAPPKFQPSLSYLEESKMGFIMYVRFYLDMHCDQRDVMVFHGLISVPINNIVPPLCQPSPSCLAEGKMDVQY